MISVSTRRKAQCRPKSKTLQRPTLRTQSRRTRRARQQCRARTIFGGTRRRRVQTERRRSENAFVGVVEFRLIGDLLRIRGDGRRRGNLRGNKEYRLEPALTCRNRTDVYGYRLRDHHAGLDFSWSTLRLELPKCTVQEIVFVLICHNLSQPTKSIYYHLPFSRCG